MPIYEYRCAECSFQDEYLQKVSEPPLTVCPSCGKESFRKLLSAAGFQLKGSGWYATDFRNSGSKTKAAEAKSDKADTSSKSDSGGDSKGSGESKSGESKKGAESTGGGTPSGQTAGTSGS